MKVNLLSTYLLFIIIFSNIILACPTYCESDEFENCINCNLDTAQPQDINPDDMQHLSPEQQDQAYKKIADSKDPTLWNKFPQSYKKIRDANPEAYVNMDWNRPELREMAEAANNDLEFMESFSMKDSFKMARSLKDVGLAGKFAFNYVKLKWEKHKNGLLDDGGSDDDLSFLSPTELSQSINEATGTNIELSYDENTADIQLKDGNLIINGNTIELDSLKSETHTIEVSPDGKVYLDGELLVQDLKN